HYDHMCDSPLFFKTTTLTVGPGFKKTILPGYPTTPDSSILKSAYRDQELIEIPFGQSPKLTLSQFRVSDCFSDSGFCLHSIYLY
ncbi:hypothetical protein BDV93DRAFT_442056, partial [Ceratobasidium sp. AG-I]